MQPTIDVRIVNPFLQAVIHVFKTAARLPLTPGKPFLKQEPQAKGEVTGVIAITSRDKRTRGSIALTLAERCAVTVAATMLGESLQRLDAAVCDAVGELTNMISGQARMWLAMDNMPFDAALPSVTAGQGHVVPHVGPGPVLALGFKSLYGPITVEVCFASEAAEAEPASPAVLAAS